MSAAARRQKGRVVLRALVLAAVALPSSGCTGELAARTGTCAPLAPELTTSRRPPAVVDAADGMCRPQGWDAGEVAADLVVVDGAAWLASGACVDFAARVWRSTDAGRTWRETGRLDAGLHCSAGSSLDLSVQDAETALVAVDHGAVLETRILETDDGGRSWELASVRCLGSEDSTACG